MDRPARGHILCSTSIPSTMSLLDHHPLFIHEILLEIFYALSYYGEIPITPGATNPWEAASRRNLANAALVCRAFAEPATEVLWDIHFNAIDGTLVTFLRRTLSAFTRSLYVPAPQSGREAAEAYVRILHICQTLRSAEQNCDSGSRGGNRSGRVGVPDAMCSLCPFSQLRTDALFRAVHCPSGFRYAI